MKMKKAVRPDGFWVLLLLATCMGADRCRAAEEGAATTAATPDARRVEPPIKVVLGEPVVAIMAPPEEKRWGFYQFPSLKRTTQGGIVVSCQVGDDSHAGAGEHHPSPHVATRDGGKTWGPLDKASTIQWARVLREGTHIQCAGRARRPARELGIKPVHERFRCHYGSEFDLYRYEDLPADMKGIRTVIRKPNGARDVFTASLDAPRMLLGAHRRTGTSAGPVELEGHIYPLRFHFNTAAFLELPDGTLLYVKKFMRVDEQGKLLPGECHTYLFASEDGGRSWKLRSTVAMIPDKAPWGLHEQTLTRLASGRLVCVMRSEEGGPPSDPRNLWISTSEDDGHTWREPWILNHFGVKPRLLTLAGGVTVVSYGRPGVEMRFCCDPKGEVWSKPYIVKQGTGIGSSRTTCGYTKLLATGPDRFLIVYSDFRHRDENGAERKAIKVREVIAIISTQ